MRTMILVGILGAALVAASGLSVQAKTPADVTIVAFQFVPADPSAAAGATVEVQNLDPVPHTLTANDFSFGTGVIGLLGTKTFTAPSTPGSYGFFCEVHPFMKGTLTVG